MIFESFYKLSKRNKRRENMFTKKFNLLDMKELRTSFTKGGHCD